MLLAAACVLPWGWGWGWGASQKKCLGLGLGRGVMARKRETLRMESKV